MSRFGCIAAVTTVIAMTEGSAFAASYLPEAGYVNFDPTQFAETLLPEGVRVTADALIASPAPFALTSLAHRHVVDHWVRIPDFLRFAAPERENLQYFYTAGHPALINGFQMDKRWGTSMASDKAKLFVDKQVINGDTVRFGNEENSLQDDGASNLIFEVLSRWW